MISVKKYEVGFDNGEFIGVYYDVTEEKAIAQCRNELASSKIRIQRSVSSKLQAVEVSY